MVSKGDILERGLECILFSVAFLFSLEQNFVAIRSNSHKKLLIFCNGCVMTCLLIGVVDPIGNFKIYPWLARNLIFNYAICFGTSTASCVVYCHFKAHYLSLKKSLPSGMEFFLQFAVSLNFLTVTIGYCLTASKDQLKFILLKEIQSILWLVVIIATDLKAFVLVKALMVDVIERNKIFDNTSKNHNAQNGSLKTGSEDLKLHIAKMRMFQVWFLLLSFAAFFLNIFLMSSTLKSLNTSPLAQPPSGADIVQRYMIFLLWSGFTYWSFIPFKEAKLQEQGFIRTTQTPSHDAPHSIPSSPSNHGGSPINEPSQHPVSSSERELGTSQNALDVSTPLSPAVPELELEQGYTL